MRTLIAAVAVLAFANPALADVVERRGHVEPNGSDAKACQHTITLARADAGLPPVEPNATSDEALLIAAVEKRINGCPVLVMAHDHGDVRPMPKAQNGTGRFQRIPAR